MLVQNNDGSSIKFHGAVSETSSLNSIIFEIRFPINAEIRGLFSFIKRKTSDKKVLESLPALVLSPTSSCSGVLIKTCWHARGATIHNTVVVSDGLDTSKCSNIV